MLILLCMRAVCSQRATQCRTTCLLVMRLCAGLHTAAICNACAMCFECCIMWYIVCLNCVHAMSAHVKRCRQVWAMQLDLAVFVRLFESAPAAVYMWSAQI